MSTRILVTTILVAAVLASRAAIAAPPTPPPATTPGSTVWQAPVGHLQPRAPQFTPNSGVEQGEQDQMSNFNAEQHKLDVELDKSLNICRC